MFVVEVSCSFVLYYDFVLHYESDIRSCVRVLECKALDAMDLGSAK